MAEKKRAGRGKAIPNHPLVEALASDPNQPPEQATKLFGFPGPAADPDSTRLWLDADLTTHVEVPNDAIVHSQTLENDQGTILWVDPSATLTHSTTQSQQVEAEFLGGSIAGGRLGGLGSDVPSRIDWFGTGDTRTFPCFPQVTEIWSTCAPTEPALCRPTVHAPCQTPDFPCRTEQAICQSHRPICEPLPSRIRPCISKTIPCPEPIESRLPPCPDRRWDDFDSPIVNPVGPFRPQR